MFKNSGSDIIIKCNLKILNYHHITLNLNDGSYRPYNKPNEEVSYNHVNSNQLQYMSKQGAMSVEKRSSSL